MQYQKPLKIVNSRIIDANDQEVRLWGVNYYAPFHHNYQNLKEMGISHYRAIDRDIEDFKILGVELVRMHLFDREITDCEGNVLENEHLRVLDYLIEKLDQAGIALMLTPIVWYNSAENQVTVTEGYAYWHIGRSPAFGFSNFYPKHCLIWQEEALACEERYYRQMFTHHNAFSGKTWREYDNLLVLELINEPDYPNAQVIGHLMQEENSLRSDPFGRKELQLLDLYRSFQAESNLPDSDDARSRFCAVMLRKYLRRMYSLVDEYFGKTILKTQIHYGFADPHIAAVLAEEANDCISVTVYAPCSFDSRHNDQLNLLSEIRKLRSSYDRLNIPKGLIAYEFNSPSTLQGYSLAALALMMSSMGIQLAAYFTYTPRDVAPYNPGWLVHFLNLYHTPSRAAAFRAARAIFHRTAWQAAWPDQDDCWAADWYKIDRQCDRVVCLDENELVYSGSCCELDLAGRVPDQIMGRGSSPLVSHEGNGCYQLRRISDTVLELDVLPDQWYVGDPYRGRSFNMMANRYINTNREPVISRLREIGLPMQIRYPGFCTDEAAEGTGRAEGPVRVQFLLNGHWLDIPIHEGHFMADPGHYRIIRQASAGSQGENQ